MRPTPNRFDQALAGSPILFGGPDKPYGILRDTLEALVDAAPPGSRIDWATYYFRDLALASALIRASDRGVAVRLVIEPRPRRRDANDRVVALLRGHGLAGGFKLRRRRIGLGQLHCKAYVFSHPARALVGSFNPSSNGTPDDDVLKEIGDQDRGYNLLYRLRDPDLVAALARHVAWLQSTAATPLDRFRPHLNRPLGQSEVELFLYPRMRTRLVEREIAGLAKGDSIIAAVSHMKPGPFVGALRKARANGARVELIAHATERRVPGNLIEALAGQGIEITRLGDAHLVPMHNKFVILERAGQSHAWLGSYNYNAKSRYFNDELLVRTGEQQAVSALIRRFAEMKDAADRLERDDVRSNRIRSG